MSINNDRSYPRNTVSYRNFIAEQSFENETTIDLEHLNLKD